MIFWPLAISFLIIAAAEFGDKTQLLTLALSSRYSFWKVIPAISLAIAILMALAVLFGGAINYYVPLIYIQIFAGIVFIAFGIWAFFSDEDKEEKIKKEKSVFLTIFVTFFLAELADKTQLATFVLAAKYGQPFQVWLGATLGMIFVNIIAALLGSWAKKFVSNKTIRYFGAVVFLFFGGLSLLQLILPK